MKHPARKLAAALILFVAAGAVVEGAINSGGVLSAVGGWLGVNDNRARAFSSDNFQIVAVGKGLNHPWGMDFLPDGRALITERGGGLKMLADDKLINIKHDLDIVVGGQGGLLDVAAAPDFVDSREVYFSFSAKIKNGVGTKIARAELSGQKIINAREIFAMNNGARGGRHFGGRLLFAKDGLLFATLGDRGERELAQSIKHHNGSIIRIHRDGTIPKENPFTEQKNARAEIYSYGHRNPQGLALRPQSDVLFSSEFGPQGGDEINIIAAGKNYGWPTITYGKEYGTGFDIGIGVAAAGMAQPLTHWTPSISPSGIAFYNGDKFPQWRGDLFVAALSARHLRRVRFSENGKVLQQQVLLPGIGRIRDVTVGPDGYFWLLLDAKNAPLIKLVPR